MFLVIGLIRPFFRSPRKPVWAPQRYRALHLNGGIAPEKTCSRGRTDWLENEFICSGIIFLAIALALMVFV
jgi:hypothetical protein